MPSLPWYSDPKLASENPELENKTCEYVALLENPAAAATSPADNDSALVPAGARCVEARASADTGEATFLANVPVWQPEQEKKTLQESTQAASVETGLVACWVRGFEKESSRRNDLQIKVQRKGLQQNLEAFRSELRNLFAEKAMVDVIFYMHDPQVGRCSNCFKLLHVVDLAQNGQCIYHRGKHDFRNQHTRHPWTCCGNDVDHTGCTVGDHRC